MGLLGPNWIVQCPIVSISILSKLIRKEDNLVEGVLSECCGELATLDVGLDLCKLITHLIESIIPQLLKQHFLSNLLADIIDISLWVLVHEGLSEFTDLLVELGLDLNLS